jgi:hypothetical protein
MSEKSPDERNNKAFNPDVSTVELALQPIGKTFQTSSKRGGMWLGRMVYNVYRRIEVK